MENNTQPRNIFEAINLNIAAVAQDVAYLCKKVTELEQKMDSIYSAFYPPQEQPNATGDAFGNSQISSDND